VLELPKGLIVDYRKGIKTQKPKECVVRFLHVKSANEAARLMGRKVAWPVGEHKIRGKIVALHGKNGLVIARFRRGLPSHAMGTPIEIIG